MRESGSPEILAPRETDCGEDWECRAAQISAKAMSASKFWTSDDRAPRGHRERHAKKEWSAKARNHPRVASALGAVRPRWQRQRWGAARGVRVARHSLGARAQTIAPRAS